MSSNVAKFQIFIKMKAMKNILKFGSKNMYKCVCEKDESKKARHFIELAPRLLLLPQVWKNVQSHSRVRIQALEEEVLLAQ